MDVDIDVPIKTLFSESFIEPAAALAVSLFELHHAIYIPDDYCDWDQSIREFLKRVAMLPKQSPEEFGKHLQEIKAAFRNNGQWN